MGRPAICYALTHGITNSVILGERLGGCLGKLPVYRSGERPKHIDPQTWKSRSNGSIGAAAFPFVLALMAEKVRTWITRIPTLGSVRPSDTMAILARSASLATSVRYPSHFLHDHC